MLRTVSIDNITTPVVSIKKDHDDLSTQILSNYLFKDINSRIKFFKDINNLFKYYLNKYIEQYTTINFPTASPSVKKTKMKILNDNIKLVYKGGNMLNEHIKQHQLKITSLNLNIDLDTLSDYDFAICINYLYILHHIELPNDDTNLINLSNLGSIIASSIVRHFFNNTFCYGNKILKTAFSKKANSFKSYQLGILNDTKIAELKDKADNYFKAIPMSGIENIDTFIRDNKERILANEYKDNLSILFDIIKLKYDVELEFIGFSLPTTFNKHKSIFIELDNIKSDNSIKLNQLIKLIANPYKAPNEYLPPNLNYEKEKINVNSILPKLSSRFDRIKTVFSEIYPSNLEDNFGTLIPSGVINLLESQIKNLNGIVNITDKLNLFQFYAQSSDNLNLYEDVNLSKMNFTMGPDSRPYSGQFVNQINSTHENMITMSANYSLLFGSLNEDGNWTKINNFNLFRGKIPVRYYFKFNKAVKLPNRSFNYIFFDYLGELIDLSVPQIGDSYYRDHFITKDMADNSQYLSHFEQMNLKGTNITNNVTINTHTLKYNIDDIIEILFKTGEAIPWTNIKYDKRIGRLIILYLVMLRNKYSENQRIEMYRKFNEYIDNFIDQYTRTQTIINTYLDRMNLELDETLVEFLVELVNLAQRLTPTDIPKMNKFLEITKCFLVPNPECLETHDKVKNYKPDEFLCDELVLLNPSLITF